MVAFVKAHSFVEKLAEGEIDLDTHVFKVYLTNATPDADLDLVKADLAEISAGNGYTAGGNTATLVSSAETAGVYKLVLADPPTWTATGGSIGPFATAVLYSDTHASDAIVGWWPYGSSITLATGETFQVDLDQTNGVIQLT